VTMFILSDMFLRDVKTAVHYVTVNKTATNMWTGYTQPVRCPPLLYLLTNTSHIRTFETKS